MDKKLYIGQNEVVVSEEENGLVKYTLDNNEFGEVPAEQFGSMALPEAYDPTTVRIKQWKPAVRKILEILRDSRMSLLDKDFVLTRVDESISKNYEDAVAKLFGKKYPLQITLPQINDVLLNQPEEE
jgi:hypothetical protein